MHVVRYLVLVVSLSANPLIAQSPAAPVNDPNPDAQLNFLLMGELRTHSVGIVRRGHTVGITLETWRVTDLTTESLEPIARHALRSLIARDSAAAGAESLFVRFSDYEPHVTTLTWTRKALPSQPPTRTDFPALPARHALRCLIPGTPGTAESVIPGSPGTSALGDLPATPATPAIIIPGLPASPDIWLPCD